MIEKQNIWLSSITALGLTALSPSLHAAYIRLQVSPTPAIAFHADGIPIFYQEYQ